MSRFSDMLGQTLHDVARCKFSGVLTARRANNFHKRRNRILMEVINAISFISDNQPALTPLISCRNARRTRILVA